MEPEKTVYGGMNALRGVAAICVMLFHAGGLLGVELAPRGYLAVDLFFGLSGFVIAHAYDRRLTAGLSAAQFLRARLRRFYPIYALGLLMSAAWIATELLLSPPAVMTWQAFAISLAFGLLFLPSPVANDLFPFNPPSWSLLIELIVNWLYAALFHWLSNAVLAIVVVVSAALLITGAVPSDGGALATDAHGGLVRACYAFPLGVLLYRHRRFAERWRVPAYVPLLVAVASFMVVTVDLLVMLAIFPLVLAMMVSHTRTDLLHRLGAISFPLYAIHFPVIQVGMALRTRLPIDPWITGVATLLVAVVLALLVDRWLDKRWLHWSRVRQGSQQGA